MDKIKPSFFEKEIRCDFLVDEKRKKVWAVELEMLAKFDQVCREYNLTYFVFYGTLLGAARHQGFMKLFRLSLRGNLRNRIFFRTPIRTT